MATFNTIIDDARYDLRDYQTGLEFDDDELLNFVNRMIRLLESTLTSLNSDLVHGVSPLILADDVYSLSLSTLNSGDWDSIRSLWYEETKLEKLSLDELYFIRQSSPTQEGQPEYWAFEDNSIQFDKKSDKAYTLTCYYNKRIGTVTLTTSTPFNGIFDDTIREMLVMHAKGKKEGLLTKTEMLYSELFKKRAMEILLRRSFLPATYHKDF
jgi:hypothetical protein